MLQPSQQVAAVRRQNQILLSCLNKSAFTPLEFLLFSNGVNPRLKYSTKKPQTLKHSISIYAYTYILYYIFLHRRQKSVQSAFTLLEFLLVSNGSPPCALSIRVQLFQSASKIRPMQTALWTKQPSEEKVYFWSGCCREHQAD